MLIFSESTMSNPGSSSGSQAAAASQSVGSRPPSCPRPAANSATPQSNSSTPARASDSATVGNTDVVEIQEDVVGGTKRKLRSEVWKDFDLIYVKGVPKERCS
jgi:hypothetical protein